MTIFDLQWAKQKLDMPRRRRELERYVDQYLPELRTMEPGLVLDIGCGPGDFLVLCREMGHEVLGVDAKDGAGGMGGAYLSECARLCEEANIPAYRHGLLAFLGDVPEGNDNQCVAINCRGAIEQALSPCLVGQSHEEHHNCRLLDWRTDGFTRILEDYPFLDSGDWWLSLLMAVGRRLLRPGGSILISANGTKSTDGWYDATVRKAAEWAGLELVHQEGLLLHKWRKP